jgi:hypothetical protein
MVGGLLSISMVKSERDFVIRKSFRLRELDFISTEGTEGGFKKLKSRKSLRHDRQNSEAFILSTNACWQELQTLKHGFKTGGRNVEFEILTASVK